MSLFLIKRQKEIVPTFIKNIEENIDGFLFLNLIEANPIKLLLVIFYLLGIDILFLKQPQYPLLYLLIVIPTQLFSQKTPDATRSVHIFTFVFFFVVVGLNYFPYKLKKSKNIVKTIHNLTTVLILIFLFV